MHIRHHGSYGQCGDVLFSQDNLVCLDCGWQTFWALDGNFLRALCERCGAAVPEVK